MKEKFLIRTLGKAVAAGALLSGVMAIVPQVAHAIVPPGAVQLFVTPAVDGGNDAANNCTLAANPCATIGHALSEEASLAPNSTGSVINLSKGTFNDPTDTMFAGLVVANSGVTVTGAGKKTVVAPAVCASLATATVGPDAGFQAIFVSEDAGTGAAVNGVTVENAVLSGASVAGGACPAYQAGAILTGGATGDAIVQDTIESGAVYGILTDDNAQSTIISNNLTPVLCTATVKGPNTGLNAGWDSPANLKISKIPKCAQFVESGQKGFTGVFINGKQYCAKASATGKTLVLTGTAGAGGCPAGNTPIGNSTGPEIATGSTITFNTSVAPFLNWGIACNSPIGPSDATTDCAISDNSVTAGGTVLGDFGVACGGVPPIGIVATGQSTADIDGNTVANVADSIANCPDPGETTNDGIGIGLVPNAGGASAGASQVGVNDLNSPPTGHGNKVSASDNGIVVASGTNVAAYELNGNTVSSANVAGIALAGLGNGAGTLGSAMESNTASGALLGVGITLEGDTGLTIGGPTAGTGNTASGDGVGMALSPTSAPIPTTNNTIQNNSLTGNAAYGVLIVGPHFQPNELAPQAPVSIDEPNTFKSNTWSGNDTATSLAHASNILDGNGWGGGCASQVGSCDNGSTLDYEGANTTISTSNPGTGTLSLAVCNPGASAEPLPAGSQITFYSNEPADNGTFFVTKAAIVPSNGGACTSTSGTTTITVQALTPEKVGTTEAADPDGQPYVLGTGDAMTVNVNGAAVASTNVYGSGGQANSCTPSTGVFGAATGSATLNAGTGGVNATYDAC